MKKIRTFIIGFDRAGHASRTMLALQAMEKIANPILVFDEIDILKAEFETKLDAVVEDLARATGKNMNDLFLLNFRTVAENLHSEYVIQPLRLEQHAKSTMRFIKIYNEAIKQQLYKQEKKSKLKPNHQYFTNNWRKNKRR